MEINLSSTIKQFIAAFILFILPLISILLGVIFNIDSAWYFILIICWFGIGLIFFTAIQ
jgi:hypothetical protein